MRKRMSVQMTVGALFPVLLMSISPVPAAPQPGESAAFFSLETVDQSRRVESDTLFAGASTTLLAFWTTHCTECVRRLEACQALQEWGRDDGLRVVGINFDETPTSKIQLLARQAGPRMLQLYDGGGRVAAAYGAGAHSFSAILVDPGGTVRSAHFDVSPDSIAALRRELQRVLDEALGDEPPARRDDSSRSPGRHAGLLEELGLIKPQRLEAHAWGRFRWMDIDTSGSGASGIFGEAIEPGSSFRHRLALELTYSVTPALKAGGLLWLSDEGRAVLRDGPDYLSSEWGSAYVRYETQGRVPGLGSLRTSLRAGYYDAFFTPLTMMRWDKDDSPISGGQRVQGCACTGGAGPAGVLRSASLERLAPQYRFEGARWDVSWMERIDILGLYARPLLRYPDDPIQCAVVDEADMRYRQELYAGRLTAHISVPWGRDLAALSGTALQTRDFPEDWDPRCTTRPTYDPGSAVLYGADLRVPLPLRALGIAEIARSRWEARPLGDPSAPEAISATAVRGTCNVEIRPRGSWMGLTLEDFRAAVDIGYQHIGANFFSPYSAISYESNLRPTETMTLPGLAGPRGSLRVDWGAWGFGAFLKLLDPVDASADPASETAAGEQRLGSVWFDTEIWSGGVVTGGWVTDRREPLAAQASLGVGKETRRTWIAGFEQELAPKCLLLLEAQFLRGESGRDEYRTRMLRAMVDVEF